jgi:hypothetical protein
MHYQIRYFPVLRYYVSIHEHQFLELNQLVDKWTLVHLGSVIKTFSLEASQPLAPPVVGPQLQRYPSQNPDARLNSEIFQMYTVPTLSPFLMRRLQ